MSAAIDLTGQRFGRLLVVAYSHSNNGAFWRCRCDCGGEAVRRGADLRRALTRGPAQTVSCGCTPARQTHGLTGTRLYRAWYNMVVRCTYPDGKNYANYGKRGIKVCDEWLNSSDAFMTWALAHGYADDLELDRIDNDGDYTPTNCRFVTREVQVNNRRCTRRLTWNGRTMDVREWAAELGVSLDALQLRITRGWPVERIFTQPVRRSPR